MKDPLTRLEIVYPSSNGSLAVKLQIKDIMVSRVLIDNRSEVNILFRRYLKGLTS